MGISIKKKSVLNYVFLSFMMQSHAASFHSIWNMNYAFVQYIHTVCGAHSLDTSVMRLTVLVL